VLGILGRPPAEFLAERRSLLCNAKKIDVEKVAARISDRDAARKGKDYARADEIRNELKAIGVEIMDTPRGTEWRVLEE
jgi:cysteinyl-tRNA synthetase